MDGISRAALLEIARLGLLCSMASFALPACAAESAEDDASGSGKSYDEGDGLGEGACADICGSPGCGSCPPAVALVDADGFLIDATEVRNGEYAALLEVDFDAAVVPAGCEWKSGFEPGDWADDLDPDLPVVNVDWCDAAVFCAWTGKRLCGAIGGGPADWKVSDDAETDQWYRACSNAGQNPFPYGTAYNASTCNGREAQVGALAADHRSDGREGGLPGLFDMSGNAWEWTDACETSGGDAQTKCRRRGGSRHSEMSSLGCTAKNGRDRGTRDNGIGFRCCAG